MTTSFNLMQDVYANFLDAYGTQAAEGLVTIGFAPMGIMPGLDPAAPGAGAAALEFVSINADALPELGGGSYMATGRTVSGTYRMMLASAQPAGEADVTAFNALKANAVEMTDNGALGSSQGPYTFYPTYAAPTNWYDPACEANWTSYAFTVGQNAPPPSPPTGPSTPPRHFLMPLQNAEAWRLTTTQGLVYATPPTASAAPSASPNPSPGAAAVQGHTQTVSPAVAAATFHPAPILSQHALASTPVVPWHPPPEPQPVANNSSPQPAPQPEFTLSFEYCVLQLRRPWLSGDLLADPQWYMAGAHAGDYADGPTAASQSAASAQPAGTPATPAGATPATGASAAAPSAPFSWLPVGCIAIKNLTIKSTSGALDPVTSGGAFQGLTTFGPFALNGAQSSTNSLTNPGIQIVAWICAAQPMLPPATDPALIPPTAGDTAGSVVSTAVGVLEGLLGGHGTAASLPYPTPDSTY